VIVAKGHNQCPVIYDREMGRQRLEGSFGGSPMILVAILQPLPSELMEVHEVSKLVNSPENDSAACVQEWIEGEFTSILASQNSLDPLIKSQIKCRAKRNINKQVQPFRGSLRFAFDNGSRWSAQVQAQNEHSRDRPSPAGGLCGS
jgi:hypothetical protein